MRRPATLALLLLLSLLAASCAGNRKAAPSEVGGLDRKLSTFAYIEDGNLVALVVGTRAARYREEAAYMPVEVVLANGQPGTTAVGTWTASGGDHPFGGSSRYSKS